MSQTNENADSLAALGNSIHLNEEDWLQLLQKLTPSSIDNLQQTLKRIQQRDAVAVNSEKLTFLNTASQLCGSSLLSSPVSESNTFASQGAPIVMSLGVAKATVPSMITVPSVLNVTKTAPTAMQNTIILPPSALLIAPSGPGQSVSIDSCVPVSGINRLVVTGGGLVNPPTASTVNSTSASDSLSSLNTLANAAVAVAANATSQAQWSSALLGTCKPTSSADTVRFSSGSSSSESPIRTVATAVNSLISGRTTSVDGLITSICNLQSSELSSQFLPTVGATGLTVYPLQVSANGPTLFLAASPTSKTGTLAHSFGIVSTSSVQASHCNTITTPNSAGVVQSTSSTSTTPSSASSSSTSFLAFGSIPIHSGSLQTPVISSNLTNTNSTTTVVVSPSPGLATSTPRNKPKFKALWETNVQTDVDRGLGNINTAQVNTDCLGTTDSNVKSRPISTECVPLSPQVISHSPILRANQRHSPMLGVKSIGQTPKRLAATAASLSDDRKSPNQSSADGSKKLLLVCSQAKSAISGGETSIVVAESALSKALQPSPASLRIGNVRTESADSNLSTSVNASDSKSGHSGPPLLAPVTAMMKELRSAPITTGAEHDMMSATLGTRVESLLRKSFEGSRRTFKEEPVGEDEARRRAKRRERNRVAAARCRQRRQDQIVELQYRVGTLTRTGDELRSSLQSLNTERLRLEGLIRQHGFAGCTEAEDLLNSTSVSTEKSDSCCDVNMGSGELSTPKCSSSSFVTLKDMVFNPVSTSPSPNSPGLILITNSAAPTKMECETRETVGMARPALAKLDLRRVSQLNCSPNVTACVQHSAASGSDSVTPSNGCVSLKMDEPMSNRGDVCRTVTTTGSPVTLSSPTSLSRIAARPSTLIPSKLVTDLTKLSSALVTENATSSTACSTTKDTPTPCFWPSDLQSLSPILTPSTWKLLRNLTSTSCSTSQSFLLTPTFSSLCPTLSIGSLASPTASGAVNLFASVTTSSAGNSENPTTTQSVNDMNTTPNDHTALSTGGCGDTPVPSNGQTVYLAFSNCDKMEPPEEAGSSSALQ